jgi:hypothetical protein
LLDDSTVLEKDARGVKVLFTPQRQIFNLFSLKRWWSSALLRPYAVRFVENARVSICRQRFGWSVAGRFA